MAKLSQQSNDIKLEVADLFLAEISGLRLSNKEKLKLIEILDESIANNSQLVKHLLNVDNLEEIFDSFVAESNDYLQDEVMRNDL